MKRLPSRVEHPFKDLMRMLDMPSTWMEPLVAGDQMKDIMPAISLAEHPDKFVATVEVTGMNPKEIQVSLSDGRHLQVSGEKKEEKKEENENTHYCERRFGSFRRQIELPAEVDTEKVTARSENGVLKIEMAKLVKNTPKRIDIEIN